MNLIPFRIVLPYIADSVETVYAHFVWIPVIYISIYDSYLVFHTANNEYWLVAMCLKCFLASKLCILPILRWQKLCMRWDAMCHGGIWKQKQKTNKSLRRFFIIQFWIFIQSKWNSFLSCIWKFKMFIMSMQKSNSTKVELKKKQ